MPSVTDLGQRVKQKYPGQYDDLSDDELGRKVQAKYPGAYDDFTASPAAAATATQQPQKAKKSAVESVGDFLGIGDFGRGLGTALAQGSKDVREMHASQDQLRSMDQRLLKSGAKIRRERGMSLPPKYLETLRRNEALLGETADDAIEDAPSNREFLTSAAATAVNLAGAGTIGGKAASGRFAAPNLGRGLIGTTRYGIQPLKTSVVQSAGQAGLLSGLRQFGQGKSLKESAKGSVAPALVAGSATGLLGLAAKGVSKALEKGPERLYERAVPLRTAQDTEKVIRGKATPVYGEAIKRGIRGSSKQILDQTSDAVDDIERQIQEAVAPRVPVSAQDDLFNAELTGSVGKSAKAMEEFTGLKIDTTKHGPLLEDFLEQTKVALTPDETSAMQRALTGRLTEADALTVRRVFDTYMQKNAHGLDLPNNARTVALKRVADDLRRQISEVNPQAGKLLTEQSKMIRLRDAAGSLAAKETRRVPFSRVDALMGGGAAASFAFGNPLLGAGLVGLPLARAAMTSPAVATRAAYLGSRAGQGLSRAAQGTDGLRRLIRAGIIAGSTR